MVYLRTQPPAPPISQKQSQMQSWCGFFPLQAHTVSPRPWMIPKIPLNQVELRVSLLRVYTCCFPQQGLPEFRDTELSVEQSVERLDIG